MKKSLVALSAVLVLGGSSAFAHTALMSCFDNGDGTVTCEGGFSDGSSAGGVGFYLLQGDKKLNETKLNEFGEVSFKKPSGEYIAVLNGGEGHMVQVKSNDILE